MRPMISPSRWHRRALAGLAAAATAAGLVAAAAPVQAQEDDGITVYLASDSTVQTYDPYWEPQAGWGQVFDRYFDEEVTVVNRAIGGRSSRSFVEQGRLDAILDEIQPGDYLFIQFGHNDATQSSPERYTPPEDYKVYLRDHYMAGAIEKGAIPVLVTPVSRRNYDPATGKTKAWIPEYVEKVYELHEETGVAMVDLAASSRAYLDEIGPEESKSVFLHVPPGVYPNRPNGTEDNTHFQEYGAIQMARLVAEGTATLGLSLSPHVVGVEPPANVPDAPTNLRAETVSNASVTLLWDEVETDIYRVYLRESAGEEPVTGNGIVDGALQGENEWRLGATSTVGKGRVSGLAEEVTYDFAVAAVNGKGEGEYSEVLTVTTATAGWKFDIGPASQVAAAGYAEVNTGTGYTAERGYGFVGDMSPVIDRDRGCESDVGRDFTAWFGGNYEFAVDVPNGRYTARVWVGDCLGSSRTDVAFEGYDYGAANAGNKTWATHDFEGILVEDGQLNMNISGQTGHFNGLELTRTGDLPDGGSDEPDEPCEGCVKAVESLDRSPVAVDVDGGVYLGWRKLGNDPAEVSFNVYRDGKLIAQTASTNLTDANGAADSAYYVAVVENGAEVKYTGAFGVWAGQYIDVDMDRPEGGTTPDGVEYTYAPNDATVADLTGDGKYEIIQKWDPSNSKDNSHSGYTGNVYVDAYTLAGERLWRIDLGVNIRAGAHYTSLSAYDFDGDGKGELVLKTGDGTVDGAGNVIGDPEADHRNSSGRIITGPEYLTVFDGQTGAALDTVDFEPDRGTADDWGDGYGNRVDRLMASVAYLDGEHPSLVTSRGIYTKTEIFAWDWDGEHLVERWGFKSQEFGPQYSGQGNHQMSIADVDGDGRDEIVYGALTVNDDGTPLYSSELGHGDALHVSDFDPTREGLEIFGPYECMSCSGGIGAAMRDAETGEVIWSMDTHASDVGRGTCGDIDPNHLGAECWATTADGEWNSRSGEMKAADGTHITYDIPSANHMVWWDGDLGREILDHEFNQEAYEPIYPFIAEWNPATGQQEEIFAPEGVQTNGGTKGNPVLTADLYGDWREEVVLRKESNDGVRIFTTTIETEHSIPTLMHDPQYRLAIAWQNESYNQPPWPSFYIGYDADPADVDWAAIGYDTAGPTEPPVIAGDCSVDYQVASDWGDGFVVQTKVTNTGDEPIEGWQLVFDSSIESIIESWGGTAAVADGKVTVDPADWNTSIDPGQTRNLGFKGTGDPNDPGEFLMDGKVCAAA